MDATVSGGFDAVPAGATSNRIRTVVRRTVPPDGHIPA